MNELQIFNKDSSVSYNNWYNIHGLNLDIYYHTSYLEQDAILNQGSYEIFTFRDGSDLFIYPYIKKNLNELCPGHFDITSPYGYCGPYCNNENLFEKAELAFIDYIKSQNVITEFVRYHYLYNSKQQFQQNILNIKNRTIVLLNTSQLWDTIWGVDFSSTNRNIVRKLEKEGFKFEIADYDLHISRFIEMYYATMTNAKADKFYYFDENFFDNLKKKAGNKLFLARVEKNNVTYCYSLFFAAGNILTYYLSARNLEHIKVPATNLMLSKAANWAHQNCLNYFNLGGGLSDDDNDSLFKFKHNFSKQTQPFYIGKRIYLQDKYDEIVNNWIALNGADLYNKVKFKLQFYHINYASKL